MPEPTEGWLARLGRWAVWLVIAVVVTLYASAFDDGRIWTGIGWGLAVAAGGWAIQGMIVEPILAKLQQIESKIDRLTQTVNHYVQKRYEETRRW